MLTEGSIPQPEGDVQRPLSDDASEGEGEMRVVEQLIESEFDFGGDSDGDYDKGDDDHNVDNESDNGYSNEYDQNSIEQGDSNVTKAVVSGDMGGITKSLVINPHNDSEEGFHKVEMIY